MKKFYLLTVISISLLCVKVNAQVGIGTTTPDASAMLEIKTTNKGLLVPRVALTGIYDNVTISTPAVSLLVYNTATTSGSTSVNPGYYYWNGISWVMLSYSSGSSSNSWLTTGNAGTVDGTNFIGTTDNVPFNIKVNNQKAGRIDNTLYNSFWGFNAGNTITTGNLNTGVGAGALSFTNTGNSNTATGINALFINQAGSTNTANGSDALHSNQSGYSNVAVGSSALYKNVGNSNLVALGDSALFNSNGGIYNTAVGSKALYSNTVGFSNTAIGYVALQFNQGGFGNTGIGFGSLVSSNANGNTATGAYTLQLNTTGSFNAAFGYEALDNNQSGNNNTACGGASLYSNTTGFSNVAVGTATLYKNTVVSNIVAIGDSALFNNGQGATLNYHSSYNTAVGSKALFSNTIGSGNTANGTRAMIQNLNGDDNTANGGYALAQNISGSANAAFGYSALAMNNLGSQNSAIGYNACATNQIGNNNTTLGAKTDVLLDGLTNATAIGYNAKVGASNSMVLGGTGTDAVKVGIGVTSPIVTLHVKGTANIFSGATTHTGNFYNGNSNVDGIEMVSSGTDAYMGIQRALGYGLHITKPNVTSNNGLIGFLVNGTGVGSITTNGTTTAYNTTSDSRLKENMIPTHYGLQTILKIKVQDYNYRSDSKKISQTGFIAQQLYDLYPQAVQVGGEDVKINPWMVDYGKITPLLVIAIQDQQRIIEDQKEQIKNINEKLDALVKAVSLLSNK